jgi:adenylyltransferase/sulfurtransferase
VQLTRRQDGTTPNFAAIADRLQGHGKVRTNEFMLRADVMHNDKPYELTVFPNGRAIVKGTDDVKVARTVYAKFVGA